MLAKAVIISVLPRIKKNLCSVSQSETVNWNLDMQFVVDAFQPALAIDSKATNPMTNDVGSPSEILSMFGPISYDKGASILRMTEHIIGKDNFQKAVQQYINDKLVESQMLNWRAINIASALLLQSLRIVNT